jgi:hypothetical protein
MPSFDSIYAWSRDWQYLLAGLSTVVAACIFAIGSITAALIRAGGSRARAANPDLRKIAGAANDDPTPASVQSLASLPSTQTASISSQQVFSSHNMAGNLDHLRWLIRTGLSPQLSSDVSHASLIHCCERILQMQLENATLPNDVPEAAQLQRKVLLQDASALRELAETRAASSEIISALIRLNASARELATLLSDNADTQPGAAGSSR